MFLRDDAPDYRCIREADGCPNLAEVDPDIGVLTLCCACRDGQAPVADIGRDLRLQEALCKAADDAAPVHVDETPTKRVRTLTDAELLAEMEQHAEAGQ